jgi:hypothetical protein
VTSTKRNTLLIVAAIIALGLFLTQCTYIPKAPAKDFGVGVLECAAVISPESVNLQALEANGWEKRDTFEGAYQYKRADLNVRLVLKEGAPGCLVQGIAESSDQFPAVIKEVRIALKKRYGNQLKTVSSPIPDGLTYQTGDLLHTLSAKKTADGHQIRVVSIWNQEQKQ